MSPGGQSAVRNFKVPFLAIALGGSFDQPYHIPFTEDIKVAVGIGDRSLSHAAVTPGKPAGVELNRGQDGVVEAIQISVNEHDTAVMILHVSSEIAFHRLHFATLSGQVEEPATGAVR